MFYTALRTLLLVGALGLTTLAPSLFPPDVTGVWKIDVENEAATETVMVTLTQQDSTITGNYLGYFGVTQLAGLVNGKEIAFTYDIDGTLIKHVGLLRGNTIKGFYNAGNFEQGDFRAMRVR